MYVVSLFRLSEKINNTFAFDSQFIGELLAHFLYDRLADALAVAPHARINGVKTKRLDSRASRRFMSSQKKTCL